MAWTFARYAERRDVALLDQSDVEPGYIWFSVFEITPTLFVPWPPTSAANVLRSGLSVIGLPRTRRR